MQSGHRGYSCISSGITVCAILATIAGSATRAWADDDDKKLLDKKPAILGRMYSPDPWKLQSEHTPVGGGATDASFQSKNVNLKTWMPLNQFTNMPANPSGADCWGYTSPSGREYALMGLSWGDGIVEVTNPSAPQLITVIPGGGPGFNSLWRDITVVGTYAYAGSDQSGVGIQVIDLANIDAGSVTLVRNWNQGGGHSTSHTLVSNPTTGYLYVCGGNVIGGGVMPVTTTGVNGPTFPTFAGPGWANPNNPSAPYVHEAQIVSYTSGPYAGKEVGFFFAAGPYWGGQYTTGLAIVDLTNKAGANTAANTISQVWYPGIQFCHQGWVTDDKKYLYIDDELDAPSGGNVPRFLSRIFDISDLSTPRMVSVATNGLPSVDHNQYVKGRYLYQSNYTTGLRIWDISNPLKPYEVAWFDTRIEDDGTGYNGAWGNYPYFNSGTILISDLERGLFTVKMSILEFDNTYVYPTTVTPGAGAPVSAKVTAFDASIGTVSVMASVNGGAYVAYPMSAQGGGVYDGNLPATSGFDRVRYYFKAETTDLTPRVFTWPLNATGGDVFTAYAQDGQTPVYSENFQTGTGWTVQGSVTTGAWTRATPLYNGGAGSVIGDADGSGMCYVTGNTTTTVSGTIRPVGVTGGTTRLLSPVWNLTATPEARLAYSRWFCSTVGTTDNLVVEVTANGTTWLAVESIGPASGGWASKTIRVADYVPIGATIQFRFSVGNSDSSVTEAGVDAVSIVNPTVNSCYPNCDGSSTIPVLNANDFQCFLNSFAAQQAYANCDGSSVDPVLNANDFQCFLNSFASGCP